MPTISTRAPIRIEHLRAFCIEAMQRCGMSEFDLTLVGTPPEHHSLIAREAIEEAPQTMMISKMLCPPTLETGNR